MIIIDYISPVRNQVVQVRESIHTDSMKALWEAKNLQGL
jgi:hypothetical protein